MIGAELPDTRMRKFMVGSQLQVLFPRRDHLPSSCALVDQSVLVPIPNLEKCLSWNTVHLFAGFFWVEPCYLVAEFEWPQHWDCDGSCH